MNWSLVFKLSLFGLAMAFATVFFITSNVEPFLWLVISVICAYIIAKNCTDNFFLHGFMVSIINSVWITLAHVGFYHTYIANHSKEAEMLSKMPSGWNPKVLMLITGPIVGVISGLIFGLFAFIASRLIKRLPSIA
jgi:hypothetical protein